MWFFGALFSCVFTVLFSASGRCGSESAARIPSVYDGYFTSQFQGELPQQIVIVINSQELDENGNLVAQGIEYYTSHYSTQQVPVRIRIDVSSLRFELVELPRSEDNAVDSSIGEPMIGRTSRDFSKAFGPDLGASDHALADFVLRSRSLDVTAQLR